jgi:hypothetical protein
VATQCTNYNDTVRNSIQEFERYSCSIAEIFFRDFLSDYDNGLKKHQLNFKPRERLEYFQNQKIQYDKIFKSKLFDSKSLPRLSKELDDLNSNSFKNILNRAFGNRQYEERITINYEIKNLITGIDFAIESSNYSQLKSNLESLKTIDSALKKHINYFFRSEPIYRFCDKCL